MLGKSCLIVIKEGSIVKKIVVFVGVDKSESSTLHYIREVLKEVNKKVEIDVSYYTQKSLKLELCKGCCQCFYTHKCNLDQIDHMDLLKKEMLEADFVILGSPVYLHNVSGSMKNFIDRLSYWSHIFALRGKNGMVVSSADSNGGRLVVDYLERVMAFFGCPVVASANIFSVYNYDDGLIEEHAEKIVDSLKCPIKSNKIIDAIYITLKKIMECRAERENDVEYQYWKKNHFFDVGSFETLIK